MNRKAVFPFEFRPTFRIFASEMLSTKTKLKRQGRGVAIRKRTLTDGRVVVDKVMKSVSEKLE